MNLYQIKYNLKKIIFSIIYLYFIIISYLIIPVGDDYFWWGKNGHYLLTHNFFSTNSIIGGSSNGRYLGNILEILIMHSTISAAILYAGFMTLLIWCIWKLTGKTTLSLIFSLSIFTIVQFGYIQGVFLWYAGFINYVPPTVTLLLYLILINDAIKRGFYIPSIFYFLLSFIGGLFVEHITLYQIFIGIISIFLFCYLNKHTSNNLSVKITYFYTLGAIFSSIIMFSNPSYYHSNSNYRQVSFSFSKALDNYIKITHFWIITFNYLLIILICISIIIISLKTLKSTSSKLLMSITSTFFIIYYAFTNIYIQCNNYLSDSNFQTIHFPYNYSLIDSLISLIFILFLIISTFVFFKGFKNIDIHFYIFCMISLCLPFFLIISPIFVREFFNSFIFMFMISIIYTNKALSLEYQSLTNIFNLAFSVCTFLTYLMVMFIMITNYQSNITRVNNENFLHNNETLEYKVPHSRYVFQNDSLIMQSPTYWDNRLNYKFEDYFYNWNY